MGQPIVVTGSHRSGTTWVGRMLGLSGEAGYVHEPFNPRRKPGWSGNRIPYWYLYICPDNEAHYRPVVDDVVRFRYPIGPNLPYVRGVRQAASFALDLRHSIAHRALRRRPLLKDPLALFSTEWLSETYGARIVVLIRHPNAFVGSIKRLNWRFKFRSWLAQDLLVRDWLWPFRADMHHHWSHEVDIVDQGILMWNAIHHVVHELRRRHPAWIFLRHEDVASAPVDHFRDLYRRLDLTWSPKVESGVRRSSSRSNPGEVAVWRHQSVRRDSRATALTYRSRLSPSEIERVRAGTEEMASRFYGGPEAR